MISLPHFGFLSITGRDAQKFLQGYTTCDLDNLDGRASIGAICNIQGRMVCNFRILATADGFLLRIHGDLVQATMAFLKKYIVFSKAEMSDVSDEYRCFGLTADEADHDQPIGSISATDRGFVVQVSDLRAELWSSAPETADSDVEPWLVADIDDGYAWVDDSSTEAFIPQMFNLHQIDGISFDKGCYLGQEIVARMQYRGELKKRLHRGHSDHAISPGDNILTSAGKPAGTVVAAAGGAFLAVIQTRQTEGEALTLADGSPVNVTDLAQD